MRFTDDFKPKSVDSSQPGRMKVNGEEVSVSLPTMQVIHDTGCGKVLFYII